MISTKKKVYVITRHAITNYGSLLQTLATQKIIQRFEYDSKIINYIRDDEDYKKIVDTLLDDNKKWNKNFFTRMLYKLIQSPEYFIMGKKFEIMRLKYLTLTKRVSTKNEINNIIEDESILLTGSDQVWGPVGKDKYDSVYFLDFGTDNNRKVAYAASFGRTLFDQSTLMAYRKLLKNYNEITVRENSAIEVISKLGLNEAKQVLDPTLLLSKEEWNEYIPKLSKREYVLIYQLHANTDMDRYALEYARRCNVDLIRVSPMFHQISRGGKFVYLPDIGKFLALIQNAKCMITDSFHGTAFAINLETQFINVLGNCQSNHSTIKKTITRNQSLLKLTGLEDRVLHSYNDFSYINKSIDYKRVSNILSDERKKSLNILCEMLGVVYD